MPGPSESLKESSGSAEVQRLRRRVTELEAENAVLRKVAHLPSDSDAFLDSMLRISFDQLDTNHDGNITASELRHAFAEVGVVVGRDEVNNAIHRFGSSESLTFENFASMHRAFVHRVFEELDVDHTGKSSVVGGKVGSLSSD